MTQKDLVREHLYRRGRITPAKALVEYKIWRLADVIYKLKGEGLNIVTLKRRSESGTKYAQYLLIR